MNDVVEGSLYTHTERDFLKEIRTFLIYVQNARCVCLLSKKFQKRIDQLELSLCTTVVASVDSYH